MPFRSILFEEGQDRGPPAAAPDYFPDLNLDQIVDAITAGREEYDLSPFFHQPLKTLSTIRYRQDVMRDLETGPALECINRFAASIRLMRQKLTRAEKLYCKQQQERWFLHAVETYCGAVGELEQGLARLELASAGLLGFRAYPDRVYRIGTFRQPGGGC